MLAAQGLTLWRGERRLFHELSFSLAPGSLLLLKGPNGSGKTSLLRALAGLLPLESGDVRFNGVPLHKDPAGYLRYLAWLGHKDGLKGELNVRRNLAFLLRLWNQDSRQSELLDRAGLNGLADRAASELSYGQRRRLALAGLIGSNAPLWLLDEPDANLDAQGRDWLVQELGAHLRGGGCVVLAGHRMDWRFDTSVSQLTLGVRQ